MKCPLCREEISAIAQICPYCRSDLKEHYYSSGDDASPISPFIGFMVKWVAQTLMLYIPFWLTVNFFIIEMSDFFGWLSFLVAIIVALIYRNKLPVI